MHRIFLMVFLSLLLTLSAMASPSLDIGEEIITITGIEPGAEVWLYGVSRYVDGYRRTLEITSELLVDEDEDGAVAFEPPYGVDRVSVWVASEGASGAVALGSRTDYMAKVSTLSSVALAASTEAITVPRRRVEVLLIRPEGKAWTLTLGDGASADADGLEDGRVTLLPSALTSQTDSPEKPGTFGKDDVLVVIDSKTLEVLVSDPALASSSAISGEEVSR